MSNADRKSLTVGDLIRELAKQPFDDPVTVRTLSGGGRYMQPRPALYVFAPSTVMRQGDPEPAREFSIIVGTVR